MRNWLIPIPLDVIISLFFATNQVEVQHLVTVRQLHAYVANISPSTPSYLCMNLLINYQSNK